MKHGNEALDRVGVGLGKGRRTVQRVEDSLRERMESLFFR